MAGTTIQGSRRERHKADRRQRVYAAAIALFKAQGYEAVSVDAIVAQADVAKGTFFNYFPSKRHVLAALLSEFISGVLDYGETLRTGSARDCFRKQLARMARYAEREGPLFDALVREVFAQPDLQEVDKAAAPRVDALYRGFLARGVKTGELREDLNLDLAGSLIGDLWTGTLIEWIWTGRSFALPRRLSRKLDLLFEGLGRKTKTSR
jgi:AcrR family transcriptional regulator